MAEPHLDVATDESDSNDRQEHLLLILKSIHEREVNSYVPGQGTALDTVNAIRRKQEVSPIEEWATVEIEATIFNLSHLFDALEVRGDVAGDNCEKLSRRGEALHQDLIDGLQNRGRFKADTRQYLTNQFGSACSLISRSTTPEYCAANHFEEVHQITDIQDRIADLFESGNGVTRCECCGETMPAGMFDKCSACSDNQ